MPTLKPWLKATQRLLMAASVGALLCLSRAAWAEGAGLFISAHELIFDQQTRSHSVHITNRGNRTGVYALSWIDHTMTEAGTLAIWKSAGHSPWSLQPYIRFSPRRVTLRPGESQRVRITLKKDREKLAEGELFSHLNVLVMNDNLEATQRPGNANSPAGNSSVKARTAISIPVIWRNTPDKPRADISVAAIGHDSVQLRIERIGQASTRGFLHLLHRDKGKAVELIDTQPFIIYSNIKQRLITLNLNSELPQRGQLEVYYSRNLDNTQQLSKQTRIPLQAEP